MLYQLATLSSVLQLTIVAALPSSKALPRRQLNPENLYADWPSYADLPLDPSYPTKAAWGVWGLDDVNGALNHITPSTIQQASHEIKLGRAINLNLEFSFIPRPINPERRPVVYLYQPEDRYTDDVITLNTQMSTQYDGLRHFAYGNGTDTSTWQYYNNLIGDYEEVIGWNHTNVLGIQQAAQKGIAARGVLLDYKGWMDAKNQTFDPLVTNRVPASQLQQVAEWQGLTGNWSRPGDILLIRWGWVEAFGRLNSTEKQNFVLQDTGAIGIEANDAAAEWLWDHKFSVVGSDAPAFEATPLEGVFGGEERSLHEILLAGWGTSILEFIDTEGLVGALKEAGRSTFFMTIQTLNIDGGVASPPNAMAII